MSINLELKAVFASNNSLTVPVFKKCGAVLQHLPDVPRPTPGIDYIEPVHVEVLANWGGFYAQDTY